MNKALQKQLHTAALQHCGLAPGSRVLHVLCGDGTALHAICREVGAEGYGFDPDADAIAATGRLNKRWLRLHYAVAGLEDNLYPGGFFDVILCAGCLRKLTARTDTLHRLLHLLKPCGRLAVLDDGDFTALDAFCEHQHITPHIEAPGPKRRLYILTK